MKFINCPLCEANDTVVAEVHTHDLFCHPETQLKTVVCQRCGFVYLNPQIEQADLRQMYAGDYAGTRKGMPGQYYIDRKDYDAEVKFRWFERHCAPDKPGRMLDIGSAAGNLLKAYEKRGWEVQGIEPTNHYVEYSRTELGLNVEQGFFEDGVFPPASFDLVVLSEVLEHIPNPSDSLVAIFKILKPNGILYLDTPNVWNPNRLRLSRYFRGEHLHYFSPTTLSLMLQKIGFEPLAIHGKHYLYAVARKALPQSPAFEKSGDKAHKLKRRWRTRHPRLLLTLARCQLKNLFIRLLGYRIAGQLVLACKSGRQ